MLYSGIDLGNLACKFTVNGRKGKYPQNHITGISIIFSSLRAEQNVV